MGERISDEVYECAGCAGEVPVVDAVWLPEPRPFEADASKARPYCCRECFEAYQKALAAQRARIATRAALASALGTGQDKAQPTPTSAPSSDVPTAAQERADLREEAEALARDFHETYERLAPSFGYETRPDTRTFDPASKNGQLMVAVAREILARRPHLTPATAIGTTVREEVVSELSRAIDLIDHEDQAATREARDLLIRLKALLSAQSGTAGEVG